MSYFNRLSFARGYYTLSNITGIITITREMPKEMRIRFWATWIDFRRDSIENKKKGIYRSSLVDVPIEDEDPNAPQYADILDEIRAYKEEHHGQLQSGISYSFGS